MDGRDLFPGGWHPQDKAFAPDGSLLKNKNPSRTAVGGVRYYFIDFGISTQNQDRTIGSLGQEPSPELSDDVPYDPYKLDVYILGMTYRHFLMEYMTPIDPEDRPTAAEALQEFMLIKDGLSQNALAQRLHSFDTQPSVSTTIKDIQYRVSDFLWTARPKRQPSLVP
ncbi:hypothetical protein FRC00_007978 [Tulasnella sp. 408]|nr:hypothetical protein FRC00_007978 [Tulasnella sp. 408]